MQLLLWTAAPWGLPPFSSIFAPTILLFGNVQDLWLVIGLLLLGMLAGGGILLLLTGGLDRAEDQLLALPARELTKAPPEKAPEHKSRPSRKNP